MINLRAVFLDAREIIFRFSLGGAAVVICYVISVYSPAKFVGGIFAAFPAVMTASIMMAGLRDGNTEAAEVAKGAVAGMVGCTACVISALYLIRVFNSWTLGLVGAVLVWLIVSVLSNVLGTGVRGKRRHRGHRGSR